MSKEQLIQEFEDSLNRLVGLVCSDCIAGPLTGSILSIRFREDSGGELKDSMDVGKVTQPYKYPRFSLFVWSVWRIDSRDQILCGAWSNNEKGKEMQRGLNKLQGETVQAVSLTKPAFDLTLQFSGGFAFKIFCDSVDIRKERDNYTYFIPEFTYTVGLLSKLRREKREEITD
jgi:hypothetical protein